MYADSHFKQQVDGKWVYVGSFFHEGVHDRFVEPKLCTIRIEHPERIYLAHISLTMLSAFGGDFDEDDTVYADIYSVDDNPTSLQGGKQIALYGIPPAGGVWEHHFGHPGEITSSGTHLNMGLSSYVGPINNNIVFRIFIHGDNWVGASYFIMQLIDKTN